MAEAKTFSESWYRVAGQRIHLRPHVTLRRQFFRGEKWYVLEDPFTNQFFRLRPAAYAFVARLAPDRTVEEVWKECLEKEGDEAPGQEDVIRLLAQLYRTNLLQYQAPEDSRQLFERHRKQRQREIRSRLLGIMFARFPLLDPDAFLKRMAPVTRWIFGPAGAVLWLVAVAVGLKAVADRFGEWVDQTQGVLAPGNLVLLYAALVVVKTLHEFGHAAACRRFGGEVHTMGVMLLVFTPVPYMDATASWAFRSRGRRALVGAAGMLVEIFVAALAAVVWANTGPGTLHGIAYNVTFVASVSTILFNANPLLRFDGYYILSDLLDIPNLHSRAVRHLTHLVERYAFGWKDSESPARSPRERTWLTVFGIVSGVYRVLVFTAVILFVADQFLLAGLIMAFLCIFSWGLVPVARLVNYLATSPHLERTRSRAVAVCVGTALAVAVVLGAVPFPAHVRAPGILEARQFRQVACDTGGRLEEILADSGTDVRTGRPLFRLRDNELDAERTLARARCEEARAMVQRAMGKGAVDLAPLRVYEEAVERRSRRLDEMAEALTVRAPCDGRWIAPDLRGHVGAWLPRGAAAGHVVNESGFEFSAIVSQKEAARLVDRPDGRAMVRLKGQAGITLAVAARRVIPADQQRLPSAALGWHAGGEVAVDLKDASGLKTAEPFFQVIASVEPAPGAVLLHGRSGRIRFDLGREPLLRQWMRAFRQLIQSRYRL